MGFSRTACGPQRSQNSFTQLASSAVYLCNRTAGAGRGLLFNSLIPGLIFRAGGSGGNRGSCSDLIGKKDLISSNFTPSTHLLPPTERPALTFNLCVNCPRLLFLWSRLFLRSFPDVEPPWIQCPRDIVAGTDERRNTGNVSWNVPTAADNSNEEVRNSD